MVPWFNSHSYARHCTDSSAKHPTLCVLALACQPGVKSSEFASFASSAREMLQTAAFKSAPLQFAKVDVHKQTDMEPLCKALPKEAQESPHVNIGESNTTTTVE